MERDIPEEVAAFARRELGGDLEFQFAGWPHAESRIWRARLGSGDTFYVKEHAQPYLFARHLFACREWASRLPVNVPALVAVSDEGLKTLIFSEVPGEVMEGLELPREVELEVYRQAGAVARALHSLPLAAPENFDAGADFQATLEKYCALAEGLLAPSTLDWARGMAKDSAALFQGLSFVPCHRDLSPRNWLVDVRDDRPFFSLIDFERARPDLALYEFQRMWPDHFRHEPERQTAFFDGYGRSLSDRETTIMNLVVLRTSIATVWWARKNQDPAFEQTARTRIETLQRVL